MSWVKRVSHGEEDVFDEYADDTSLVGREWASNMKKRIRDGYVDGVDAGEEASLQVGFCLGFKEGAAQTAAVGRLRGIVSAIFCWCQSHHPESPVLASVKGLLQRVSQYEDTIMDGIKNALENPPPSVTSVSESIDDLDVNQSNSDCCGGGCQERSCCRGEEIMDQDCPKQQQNNSGESLNDLLQNVKNIVSELGLPDELFTHLEEVNTIKE